MAKKKKASEDQSDENMQNVNDADDTFGLPEIEYEPINREKKEEVKEEVVEEKAEEPVVENTSFEEQSEPEPVRFEPEPEQEPAKEPYSYSFREEQKSPSVAPIVLLVIFIFILIGGGGWYYLYKYKPQRDAELKAQQELAMKQANDKKEQERLAAEARERALAEERRIADSLANAVPQVGMVETLSERTGRYYVVIPSAIDDDLLMDNANKLSKEGTHVRIIPPFRKVQFFRLAVDEGDTFADAQAKADNLKGQYGDGVWVIKY